MKRAVIAILTILCFLLSMVPAWAQGSRDIQISQPGPVSTFGFTDSRDRDVNPAIASYEMWPAWQDSFGESYSQPLIIDGTSGGTPATYIIAVGGGTAPQIAVWKNIQAQPTGQYQSNAPIWAHPIEGSQPTTSHPSLYDINGHDIVFVGTEPGASGDSYIDGFDVTGILDGTSTQGSMVLDAPDPNASDIVSAPLLMNYQGHLVLVYTDGNSGKVGLLTGIDGLSTGANVPTTSAMFHYLNPGGRTSSSPAPVMNGTAFAVGVDTGGNPGAVYVYRLQDLFTVQGSSLTWSSSPGFWWKFPTDAGVDASFSIDPSNSNVFYFADSRSNVYSANLSTKQYNWENSDVPNSIGYPGDFTNRSPAFDSSTNTLYVPVGTKPGVTQSGVIAVSTSTGDLDWVSQYSSAYADTNPSDLQIAGINDDSTPDPTNAQTAPVIMPCTEWGDPLIVEGLGDDQIAFIDSQTGYEGYMTYGPSPIQDVSPGYASGVTGEISIATDNSSGANNGLIAYTTQNGLDVLDFLPTDISIGKLTITDPTGKTLTPNAQGIYSVLAGQKYQVSATVKYNQSPSGDTSDTSWPLANVPVDGFVNTGGSLPTGTWVPQGTATTTGSQPTGGTWYPVSQLDNSSGTAIPPTQVNQLNNPMTQMMDPTVSLQAQGNTSTVEFSWTPSASDVSSTDPYAFIGMVTNENFPAGDNPPLVQAYPDIPPYNNSIIVPVDVEAPQVVLTPAPTTGGLGGGGSSNADLNVTPPTADINVGNTLQYTATLYPFGESNQNQPGGAGQNVTIESTWTSSKPGIATVGPSNGVATGVSGGMTTIDASYDGLEGDASLTVEQPYQAPATTGGLTFDAVSQKWYSNPNVGGDGQYHQETRPENTAKWMDTVTAYLTPLAQYWGTLYSGGGQPDYSTTVAAPPPPPSSGQGAPPNTTKMTGWVFTGATLTYPAQASGYTFGTPLPPEGTNSVAMSTGSTKSTASFQETWSEDGVNNGQGILSYGQPAAQGTYNSQYGVYGTSYTVTAGDISVQVTYTETTWHWVATKSGGYWAPTTQTLTHTQNLSPITGQLFVDGADAMGLGTGSY